MATRSTGAFDSRHNWTGGALSEPESQHFQQGKSAALDRLVRFTGPDADEAASIVLKRNGEEFDFQIGKQTTVESLIPVNDTVAVLHTHPSGFPHSSPDWSNLLTHPSVEQSHIITAQKTYSVHKPADWKISPTQTGGVEEIRGERKAALQRVAVDQMTLGENCTDEEFFERASQLIAIRYGLIFRIGERI